MSSSGVLPLQFPDAPDLQVWNNAAFDDDGLDELTRPNDPSAASTRWAHSSKENLSPVLENSPAEIDREIEEIEREIARLSSRLHALKIERAERKIKRTADATRRRRLSLGPAEIHSGSRLRLLKESGILTPASSSSSKQSRRVSCFWRLQEIDELNVIKERGKSASLSPKERKQPKQGGAATTGIAKKPARKDDGLVGLIQPRMLFGEGERKAAVKLPGRVVASRYNGGGGGQGEARKRSLPDTNNEEGNKRRGQTRRRDHESGRMKKRWDIAAPVEDVLPKIRALRRATETRRDSGAAKRAADLVGRRPFFRDDRSGAAEATGVESVRQVLRFGEDGL